MAIELRKVLVGILTLLTITGCGERGPTATATEFVERDSAGIRIIENPRPEKPISDVPDAGWTIVQRIGQVEGDAPYLLYRLGTVLRLPTGELVAQNGTELRFFDNDGVYLRTVGGSGEGPGEYRSIAGIVLERDTLFVFDERLNRISFLTLDGSYVGGFSIQVDFFEVVGLPPRLAAATTEGRFVFRPAGFYPPDRDSEGLVRSDMPVVAVGRTDVTIDTLAYLGRDWLTGHGHAMGVPFGRRTSAAANASWLVTTHGQSYELELRNVATGDIKVLVRVAGTPPVLSRSEFRDEAQGFLVREAAGQVGPRAPLSAQQQARQLLEPLIPADPPYETKPAWTQILLGSDGEIWAQRYMEPDDSLRAFDVFDPTGRHVGTTVLPRGIWVSQIVGDRVLGVERDSLDVQYVVELQVRIERDIAEARSGPSGN